MRNLIVTVLLALSVTGPAYASESAGMACYKGKDYLCAFDQLLAHFKANGGQYMIKAQSGPQNSAKALMESLVRITDGTKPGATVSRIKDYNAFTTKEMKGQPWLHVIGHVLAVEECSAIGDKKCRTAALSNFCSNVDKWIVTEFRDRKLNKNLRARMFAVYKQC